MRALIDGRIIELVRAGFLHRPLIIPRSVIAELQHLADQGDALKRERARFGLDMAQQLQELTTVTISTESVNDAKPVDERLIAIAKRHQAALFTTDFNLNKVAQIEGVTVLNVNELANLLRPHILPGEIGEIKIVSHGQDKRQGVGYQPDGTMVVVEQAGNRTGQTLTVIYTRMLQTEAGRMLFARPQEKRSTAKAERSLSSKRR